MAEGRSAEAYEAFSTALERDGTLAAAWINRAALLFEEANAEAALDDLTRALGLHEDVTALYNRGRVFQFLRRWPEAVADYSLALELADGDVRDIVRRRDLCGEAAGRTGRAPCGTGSTPWRWARHFFTYFAGFFRNLSRSPTEQK